MNKWLIALTVITPTFIEIVDTSVVNVSLDHIRGSLSATVDEATWAITAYLVSNAIVIPMAGWLARFFGRKRYLMFSVSLFMVSSFFCGSAWNLSSLIFFRILQGLGGGGLQPISQAILLETFPVAEHGMAMAIFGVGVMFAPILGPILGGWITDNWSWQWIFYINIPICLISLMAIFMVIKDPPYLTRIKSKIDYWGIILIAVGLGALQIVLDKGQQDDWFNSAFILWLTVLSMMALAAFVFVELRSAEPIVNLRLFKDKGFAAGNTIQFFTFGVMFGSIVLLPIYLQRFMGYTALLAGIALAPGGMATLVAMPIAGKLITKINPKAILIFGLLITAYSVAILTKINTGVGLEFIFWSRIVMGVGMAFAFIVLTNLSLSGMRKEQMGYATSIFNLVRNLGGSFGVAFVTTMLARRAQFHQARLTEGLNPFDPQYQLAMQRLTHLPEISGSTQLAQGLIYQQAVKQANVFAFQDVFFLCMVILLGVTPLAKFLRKINSQGQTVSAH